MPFLQDFIHKLEVGGGMRYFRFGLALLTLVVLTGGYNWRAFKNMSTQEAMDSAQLARNIAQGRGYHTLFIRPLSLYLVKKTNQQKQSARGTAATGDLARLKEMHPDLANPPVYPLVLAGWMKVYPGIIRLAELARGSLPEVIEKRLPPINLDPDGPLWRHGARFSRHPHDFFISVLNEILFLVVIVVVFFLARRLFDPGVAWLSAILLLATEIFWRFSVSGLSTMLLLLIFLGLVWCIVVLEQQARAPKGGPGSIFVLAAMTGAFVGLGALARYSFGWLIIPVVIYVILFGGPRRVVLALLALLVFAGVMAPWLARNHNLSGTPFGTAGYAIMESTWLFPENRLQRSMEPDFSRLYLMPFWIKLIVNTRQIFQSDLPKLGGSWITAFFLVGLLVGFRNPAIKRLRYFLVLCIVVLTVTQALGRTQLSEESPEINSENLLVLVAPLVLVYGVSLFLLLLEQLHLPIPELRYVVIGVFSVVASLPMIFAFLPPRTNPVAYPPYHPLAIQHIAGWLKENELAMSDIPWAMAWYGQRQCIWLTLKATPDAKDPNSHEDFLAVNDYQKPINVLYLTPQTMDGRFLSQWIRAGEQSWGSFILLCIVNKEVPPTFPLHIIPAGWLPEQIVLVDWERWRKTP